MSVVEGMVFAGYRIERRLGSGGMGSVYLAEHPRLPRKDALKILSEAHASDGEFRARFLREAEIAARLHHPNLVAVRDRGEEDGRLWIAMQYVNGIDVAELIRRGPAVLDTARAVWIVGEAARGIDAIHRAGLLHRDVKPANILLSEHPGGPDRVLVTDFGIARPADDSTTIGDAGGITATLAYAAPEQIRGGPLDQRADVYSLGCTLFQMLTGSVPFPRGNAASIMYAHLNDPPPRPSSLNPGLPPGFDTVIATALDKQSQRRYPSCGALAAAAQAALAAAPPVAAATPPRPTASRRAGLVLGTAALAAVLALAAIVALAWSDREHSARPRTTTSVRPPDALSSDWGAYAYAVQPFSALLPYHPFGFGYQDLAVCRAENEQKDSLSFDDPVPVAKLKCNGDQDPIALLDLDCNADRSAMTPTPIDRVEGDERWTRPSGSGYLRWSNYTTVGQETWGRLEVYFDQPNRNFCKLTLRGGANGAELRTRWWPDAPL
ncbi:serine/threonine-protein kinase [Nocardia sp. NPDC052566]|uniref:serine/threonine-protein kinase n=1 Tax=Nocardia sp. NPDC052566 TaxID=3364330 RepID=UPI0037CBC6BF